MKIGEFLKKKLEEEYLGRFIEMPKWHKVGFIVVDRVSVLDGGVDPQWEIQLWDSKGRSYSMCFVEDNMPNIVDSVVEKRYSEEDEIKARYNVC